MNTNAFQIYQAFRTVVESQGETNTLRDVARSMVTLATLDDAVGAANYYLDVTVDSKASDAIPKAIRSAVYRVKPADSDNDQRRYTLTLLEDSNRFVLGRAKPKAREELPDLEMALRELFAKNGAMAVMRLAKSLAPSYPRVIKSGPVMRSQAA